jgi:hypothetical protein
MSAIRELKEAKALAAANAQRIVDSARQANGAAAEQPVPEGICLTPADWAAREIPPQDLLLGSASSTTTRSQLSADTGLGKTMFGLARAYAIRLGASFLRWRGRGRPARVFYLDGEMPAELIKDRLALAASWFGSEPVADGFYLLSREDVENMPPLDTPEGTRWILNFIDQQCGEIDDSTFDNIASLTAGCLKEEDGARALNDLRRQLTKQKIGQLWLHHTGHDASRGYGPKLREWHLDTVMVGERLERPDADAAFTLKFTKCRRRTPDNRAEFENVEVVLEQGQWTIGATTNGGKKSMSPAAQICRAALVKALAEFGTKPPASTGTVGVLIACTDAQWRDVFNHMIPRDDPNPRATWKRGTEKLIANKMATVWGGWAWLS